MLDGDQMREIMGPQPTAMDHILVEIAGERHRQDEEWGGPEHDDAHSYEDWDNILQHLNDEAFFSIKYRDPMDLDRYRRKLLQFAAVAVAAIESHDRQHPPIIVVNTDPTA